MTIAACFVTPEGVVFGADSTTSAMLKGGFHYFNHNQKLFEIGDPGLGTLGLVAWGLAGFSTVSHRTLAVRLNDSLLISPAADVEEVAPRWVDQVWPEYLPLTARAAILQAMPPFDASANPPIQGARTKNEEEEFLQLQRGLVLGFFIGGYVDAMRSPKAFAISFDTIGRQANANEIPELEFCGNSKKIKRLMFGCDDELKGDILNSGKWTGTSGDLDQLVAQHHLVTAALPIREAADFVHACLYSTIKAMKFSSFEQACGGPIEIAVITTDRKFRWVRHKEWDTAITDGDSW